MKYIRTKNGHILRYEKYKYWISCNNIYKPDTPYVERVSGIWEEIIKQADTIEELCDEFVIKYESKDKVSLFDICNDFEATKEEYNDYQNEYKNANIYGAIWTEKGLIYVAKMNDKGELELLWKNVIYLNNA